MGLFSRKKSTTNLTQVTDTDNINISDIEDSVALAGVRDSNVNITVSDQGALDVAETVAVEGFDTIGDAFNENIELTRDLLNFQDAANERTAIQLADGTAAALGFGEDALDFADRSQVEAFAFGGDAFDFARDQSSDAFGFAATTQEASLDFVDDLANRSLDTIGDLAETFVDFTAGQSTELRNAIGDIQARESINTDARLGDITRVALFVAGGIAVAAIIVPIVRTG